MKKKLLLSLTILCLSLQAFSQSDIPVDLATGQPKISVPLFTYNERDISIPVSLNYSAKGVGVDDVSDWVGMNWVLSGVGSITREVRSLPDDHFGTAPDTRMGWIYSTAGGLLANFTPADDNNPATCAEEITNYNFINGFGYNLDTEPDVFQVNFGPISGKFIFDATSKIRFESHTDCRITYNLKSNYQIQDFTITDGSGYSYKFSYEETVTKTAVNPNGPEYYFKREFKQYETPITYTETWHLSQITSPSGANIYFTYRTRDIGIDILKRARRGFITPVNVEGLNVYNNNNKTVKKIPESIYGESFRVYFETTVRTDYTEDEFLTKIFIYDKITGFEKLAKQIDLKYQYSFKEADPYGLEIIDKRLYLTEIKESFNGKNLQPYTFEYYGVSGAITVMPSYGSANKDSWGNFSNTAGKLYIYPIENHNSRIRSSPIPNYSGLNHSYWAKRLVNDETVATGTLNKITYPTGGSAIIKYESNTYFDQVSLTNEKAGGLRVQKIDIYDGVNNAVPNSTLYNYNLSNGNSSGKLINQPMFNIPVAIARKQFEGIVVKKYGELSATASVNTTDLGDFNYFFSEGSQDLSPSTSTSVYYSEVTVSKENLGKTVYQFDVKGIYGELPVPNVSNEWIASYSRIARKSTGSTNCYATGAIKPGYFSYPYAPNPNYDFERGLLRKILVYNKANVLLKETTLDYQRIYTGNGIHRTKALKYQELPTYNLLTDVAPFQTMFVYSVYEVFSEVSNVLKTKTEVIYNPLASAKKITSFSEYVYSNSNLKQLSKVSTTNSDGITHNVSYKYPSDFKSASTAKDAQTTLINNLIDKNINNIQIEIVNSILKPGVGQVEQVVGAKLLKFGNFGVVGRVLTHQMLELPLAAPVSNFVPASVVNGTTFTHDSRYKPVKTYVSYDEFSNPLSISDKNRNTLSYHWGYLKTLPAVEISNAKPAEVVFSTFETTTGNEFEFIPNPATGMGIYGNARTGTKGLNQPAGSQYKISKIVAKGRGDQYKFSCWIKSSALGNLSLRFLNGASQVKIINLPYEANSEWKYYESVVSVSDLPSNFSIEVYNSTSVYMDDVAFFPISANIISNVYDPPYGKTSQTDSNGNTIYYENDPVGRVKVIRDQDKNIIKKFDYVSAK